MGSVKRAAGKVVGKVLGGGGSPGALGTGRFRAKTRDINKKAFTEQLAGSGTQEAIRKQQATQTQRLADRASGKAPSIAEAQLKQATDRSLKQQLAAAQTRRGGSASARERQLARGFAESRQQVASESATARLKEQQLADQALSSQLAGTRAQDIQLASEDRKSKQALEQLETQQHLAAQGANLSGFQSAAQQRGNVISNIGGGVATMLSDENQKENIESEMEIDTSVPQPPKQKEKKGIDPKMAMAALTALSDKDKKSSVRKEKNDPTSDRKAAIIAKNKQTVKDYKSSDSKRKTKESISKFGKGFSESAKSKKEKTYDDTGKSQMQKFTEAISDKKQKKSTTSSSHNPKAFLDALKAYSYEYKDPSLQGAGEGRHLGVMAQDLEKAGPVGKSMVKDTEVGKVVDYGKGFAAMLASSAHLNDRLKALESKKKRD